MIYDFCKCVLIKNKTFCFECNYFYCNTCVKDHNIQYNTHIFDDDIEKITSHLKFIFSNEGKFNVLSVNMIKKGLFAYKDNIYKNINCIKESILRIYNLFEIFNGINKADIHINSIDSLDIITFLSDHTQFNSYIYLITKEEELLRLFSEIKFSYNQILFYLNINNTSTQNDCIYINEYTTLKDYNSILKAENKKLSENISSLQYEKSELEKIFDAYLLDGNEEYHKSKKFEKILNSFSKEIANEVDLLSIKSKINERFFIKSDMKRVYLSLLLSDTKENTYNIDGSMSNKRIVELIFSDKKDIIDDFVFKILVDYKIDLYISSKLKEFLEYILKKSHLNSDFFIEKIVQDIQNRLFEQENLVFMSKIKCLDLRNSLNDEKEKEEKIGKILFLIDISSSNLIKDYSLIQIIHLEGNMLTNNNFNMFINGITIKNKLKEVYFDNNLLTIEVIDLINIMFTENKYCYLKILSIENNKIKKNELILYKDNVMRVKMSSNKIGCSVKM